MNTFVTIIEVVELGALIALVIYLIRLIRDNNELRNNVGRSEVIDRNLDELNDFHSAMIADPDIARIWQDGCADYRLNDLDHNRFSLMASQYLSMLANQRQRAESIEDWAQVEAATGRVVEALALNPGLVAQWDGIAGKIAPPQLLDAVSQALSLSEVEEVAQEHVTVTDTGAEEIETVAVVAVDESTAADEVTAAQTLASPASAAAGEVAQATEAEVVAEEAESSHAAPVGDSVEETKRETAEASPADEEATPADAMADQPRSDDESSAASPDPDVESSGPESGVTVPKPA
jgi:hypothetical protein